jgi:hypothetical protein
LEQPREETELAGDSGDTQVVTSYNKDCRAADKEEGMV